MIIAEARSGSTYLRQAINNQPGAVCHDEIFSRTGINKMVSQPGMLPYTRPLLRRLREKRDRDRRAFLVEDALYFPNTVAGFKVVYDDFFSDGLDEFLTDFVNETGMRVVHLARLNALATVASRVRMQRYQINHSDHPRASPEWRNVEKVEIKPARVARYIKKRDSFAARVDDLFPGALQVKYENLEDDFPKVLRHIELPETGKFSSNLRKIAPRSLSEIISNYPDVAKYDSPPQPSWGR
ncbi:MAG: hypothetical protein Q4F71_09975 [Paracoccus sp. (in: a-proteobacteria)]|nr:hypothetical protein [Paracoccus sp. (in: a-proteobacteria)]